MDAAGERGDDDGAGEEAVGEAALREVRLSAAPMLLLLLLLRARRRRA